ncbi:hypothetical protein C8Q78DRAFT_1082392 [Trametes maxima]|nr:hypothetical protein C8Q78DRAFT_1082392 [Trametes maxima]
MSSDDSESVAQEVLDSLSRILVENYCIIASSILLFIDWSMTFTDEVQRIWGRRFTGATAVFLLTRYVAMAERTVLVTSVFLPAMEDKLSYVRGVHDAPHAWDLGKRMDTHRVPGSPYTCANNRYPGIVSRAAALAIDTTVLVFTWIRTLGMKRESHRLGLETPLVTLLLRDGTIYFAIILFVQVFSIVSESAGSDFILWDVWPYFDQVLTVIFSCRFMLNLRGIYLADSADETTFTSGDTHFPRSGNLSMLHFSSVVGNMGAPLETSSPRHTTFVSSIGSTVTAEDDTLETSSDPLFAGLRRPNHVELQEMPFIAPR